MLGVTWRTFSKTTVNCSSAKRCLQNTFLPSKQHPRRYRPDRTAQRRTLVPKALDSAKGSDQGMSDTGAEKAPDNEGEAETVTGRRKSAAARACGQAVDGLDKLLGENEQQSQPQHRRKALRALEFAGMASSTLDLITCALWTSAIAHVSMFSVPLYAQD